MITSVSKSWVLKHIEANLEQGETLKKYAVGYNKPSVWKKIIFGMFLAWTGADSDSTLSKNWLEKISGTYPIILICLTTKRIILIPFKEEMDSQSAGPVRGIPLKDIHYWEYKPGLSKGTVVDPKNWTDS